MWCAFSLLVAFATSWRCVSSGRGVSTSRPDVVLERFRCAPDVDPTQDEAACALLRGPVSNSCDAADTTVASYECPTSPGRPTLYVWTTRSATLHQLFRPEGLVRSFGSEPGLHARHALLASGARNLPTPAPFSLSVTTSFGS